MSDPLENGLSAFEGRVSRGLDMRKDVVCHVDIASGISDCLLKVEDWISLNEGIDNHVVNCTANSVRVALFEKLIASHENLLHIIEYLCIIAQLVANDTGATQDALLVKSDRFESQMLRITLKIVNLIHI